MCDWSIEPVVTCFICSSNPMRFRPRSYLGVCNDQMQENKHPRLFWSNPCGHISDGEITHWLTASVFQWDSEAEVLRDSHTFPRSSESFPQWWWWRSNQHRCPSAIVSLHQTMSLWLITIIGDCMNSPQMTNRLLQHNSIYSKHGNEAHNSI